MSTDLTDVLQSALGSAYTIERELGGGAMARVFVAQEHALGRRVVVKVLSPELAADIGAERFRREVRFAATLQHPHIVPVLGADESAGLLYYTMPLIEGESLRTRLETERQLPIEEAVRLTRDIAGALAYAHGRGVIHRDVKPENVLLSGGHALLTDFGIAKATERASGEAMTATGMSLGTPAYMAPEQASGERTVDHRADIYALGCMLFELLTGQPPYSGPSVQSVMAQHVAAPIPSASAIRPTVQTKLDRVITRALAKNPVDRFASVAAFTEALADAMTDDRRLTSPLRRGAAARWVAIAGAAVVVSAVALYTTTASRPDLDANLLAVAPFQVLDPQFALWREGMVDILSRNLDGAGSLRSVPPTLAIRRWNGRADRASALALGRKTGAARVVYGALLRSGPDSVRMTVEIADVPRSTTIATLEMRDAADRLDRLADSAALAVLRELGRGGAAGVPEPPSSGTKSFAALKSFLQAEQHYRRNAFDSALVAYRDAIRLDSTFALAYRGATWAMMDAGFFLDPVAMEYAARASRLNYGLSRRDRLLISADSLLVAVSEAGASRRDYRPAVRQLLDHLEAGTEQYPDDPALWYTLGNARAYLGSPFGQSGRARAAFERAILLDSAFLPSLNYATGLAFSAEDTLTARRLVQRWRQLSPTETAARIVEASLDAGSRTTSETQRLLDTASTTALSYAVLALGGWPDSSAPALPLSRTILRRRVEASRFEHGSANLGQLAPTFALQYLIRRGLFREAFAQADTVPDKAYGWHTTRSVLAAQLAVLGVMPADSARYWLQRVPAHEVWDSPDLRAWWRFARDTAALLTAMTIADSIATKNPGAERLDQERLALRASLAIARGDSVGGFSIIRQISDTTNPSTWLEQLAHAEFLAANGQTAQAATLLKRLDDIASSPAIALDTSPLIFRYYSVRARVAEAIGDRTTALAQYRAIAQRLSHADPELRSLVKSAEAGMTRLTANR